MRIPIAVDLESRDGLVTKDAIVVNGLCEPSDQDMWLFKRPGSTDAGLIKVGTAQLLTYWQGVKSIIGDSFCAGTSTTTTAFPAATWNPSDKDATVTLFGSNLGATRSGIGGGMVRSTISVSSGYWVFEITAGATTGGTSYIGLANSSANLATFPGTDNNAVGWARNGYIRKNGSDISIAAYTDSDVLGFVYNAVLFTIDLYKNGTFVYQITGANVPSGALFAAVGFTAGNNNSVTANFGATAFSYSYSSVLITNLNPTSPSLPFTSQDNGSNAGTNYLMFKNAEQAWTLKPSGVPTLITDVDYPGISTVSVTGITRSGTTATATTAANTNFQVGSSVTIAGAAQADYNGVQTITGVTASSSTSTTPILLALIRVGTTVTAQASVAHGYTNGQSVTISGANQTGYNGTFTITLINFQAFSFQVTVTGTDITSPAGGSPVLAALLVNIQIGNTAGALNTWTVTAGFGLTDIFLNGETVTIQNNGYFPGGTFVVAGATGTGSFTVTTTGVSNVFFGATGVLRASTPTISSITSAGGLTPIGIVTTSAAHNFATGKQVSIDGATPVNYNVFVTQITVLSATTFSIQLVNTSIPAQIGTGTITSVITTTVGASFAYTVANSPVTPATGTITASSGRKTVPGIAYLNGYFCVMDVFGVVYTSDSDNPTSWGALNFVVANAITGAGVWIGRTINYVACFKEWSSEYLYDAKNAVGSPLSQVETVFSQIGCASGYSVASLDGALFWIAQVRQKGRSVYAMQGTTQKKISTPAIDRILNRDDLTNVYSYGVEYQGHSLYILTLTNTGITLVYDLSSGKWGKFTSLTLAASKSVTSITSATAIGTATTVLATVTTGTAHGLSDGDPVLISGANQAGYNGIFQISYVSATVFIITVAAGLTTPATGTILAFPYTESYYKYTHFANVLGAYLVLHLTDGHIYQLSPTTYQDAGLPVPTFTRSIRMDGGSTHIKGMGRALLIGDTVSDTAMIRWSDDDCNTYQSYRRVDLSLDLPATRRLGSFRRRTLEMKHIGNNQIHLKNFELEVK